MPEPPRCLTSSRLCREAYEFALGKHHGPDRRGDTDIGHPLAVAGLLEQAGFDENVIAAAILHDVVEDTATPPGDLVSRFGPAVGDLVAAMTEDESIEPYEARKREHRERVLDHSERAAAIYAADKLARVRSYRARGRPIDPRRAEHYRQTLELFSERRPELPFLAELAAELPATEVASGRR